jgi:hypothetical protein
VPHEGHVYKGANHGFHNDRTRRYDEAAAKEAWERTLGWFNKYLRRAPVIWPSAPCAVDWHPAASSAG